MADAVTVTLGGMGNRAREWIAEGRFASMSEVVREGLKALEREQEVLNAYYRARVEEAVNDPRPYIPLDDAFERISAIPKTVR